MVKSFFLVSPPSDHQAIKNDTFHLKLELHILLCHAAINLDGVISPFVLFVLLLFVNSFFDFPLVQMVKGTSKNTKRTIEVPLVESTINPQLISQNQISMRLIAPHF